MAVKHQGDFEPHYFFVYNHLKKYGTLPKNVKTLTPSLMRSVLKHGIELPVDFPKVDVSREDYKNITRAHIKAITEMIAPSDEHTLKALRKLMCTFG